MNNLKKALAINEAVQRADIEAAAALVTDNYIQHTPMVPDGKKGLRALLGMIANGELPAPVLRTVRAFTDGDYVVLHHDADWPDRKAMFEVFRFEDGLAAEHWSGIAAQPGSTAGGRGMTDGATEIADRDKTGANKALVHAFVETVLIGGEFGRLPDFYRRDVIQHNPFIEDGIEGLEKGITALREQGLSPRIGRLHMVLGEGNFVLTLSEGEFGGKPAAFYDLFRVENGKVAEHWDVVQEVPAQMAHGNGMFRRSLYHRLGGYDAVAAFVDLAFPRVASHPDLERLFAGHSMDTQFRQRQLVVDKLVSALEGPALYLGRPLTTVHRGLNITADQWETFIGILRTAMDEHGFPPEAKGEFTALFEAFRGETVEAELPA